MSPPWMPFYVADYLADTGHLSASEHGAYLLLIMHYWQKGGLPSDDRQLARIARMSEDEFSNAKAMLSEFFDQEWRHDRIEAELAKAEEKNAKRVEAGRRGGLAKGRQKPSNATSNATSNAQASSSQPCSSLRSEPKSSLRSDSSSPKPADCVSDEPVRLEKTRSDDREVMIEVVDVWNREAVPLGLAAVDVISSRRQAALRARLREMPDHGFTDPLACFRKLVANIRGSPFLLGTPGPWKADFDFAVSPKGFTKIMENTYASQGKVHAFGRR